MWSAVAMGDERTGLKPAPTGGAVAMGDGRAGLEFVGGCGNGAIAAHIWGDCGDVGAGFKPAQPQPSGTESSNMDVGRGRVWICGRIYR